jgi:hypothetical protein
MRPSDSWLSRLKLSKTQELKSSMLGQFGSQAVPMPEFWGEAGHEVT